mgnify:CR=1 FL=1
MENASIALSLVSGALFIAAYCDYLNTAMRGGGKPNWITWVIFLMVGIVNAMSYFSVTRDWLKCIIPGINFVFALLMVLVAFLCGRTKKPGFSGILALLVGVAAALMGIWKDSSIVANMAIQVAILIGFIPTWQSVWNDPMAEPFRPWFAWAASYIALVGVVAMRWKDEPLELVYPISCTILHASVPILCILRAKARGPKQRLCQQLVWVRQAIKRGVVAHTFAGDPLVAYRKQEARLARLVGEK